MRGPDVTAWQQFLASQGLNPGAPDGVFGRGTHTASVAFQEAHNLIADAIIGTRTQSQARLLGFTGPLVTDLATLVPVPPLSEINVGLSAGNHAEMMSKFGAPGPRSPGCSDLTNQRLREQTIVEDVGPFRARGWRPAVQQLQEIFAAVRQHEPQVFEQVQTAGMSCVRHVRGVPSRFSNHAWGTAIDVFFGDGVDPVNDGLTQLGLLKLQPFFNERRWFWGAEFSREDSMHFEMSRELIDDLDF